MLYDEDEQIDLWGKYLPEELSAIYGERAAVVVFISAEYAARDWTRLERRAALDRAVRERRECVLGGIGRGRLRRGRLKRPPAAGIMGGHGRDGTHRGQGERPA